MDFYLVRHGEAASKIINPERPLTPAGRQDVERLAQHALTRGVRPSAIFHSGILRARQTAEILAEMLLPTQVDAITGLLPEDDPMIARGELETANRSVMLVGHLPHLSRLASLLVRHAGAPVHFAPATIVCCSFDRGAWKIASVITPDSAGCGMRS